MDTMGKNMKSSVEHRSGGWMLKSAAGQAEAAVVRRLHGGYGSAGTSSGSVLDEATGERLVVKGLGALRESSFAMMEDVDLTKPIAEQVFHLSTKAKG